MPNFDLATIRAALSATEQCCIDSQLANGQMSGDSRRTHLGPKLRTSAVLVPIQESGSSHSLLFTRRPKTMRNHPNQVSFPGGAAESGDANAVDTALREANEEIGLAINDAEIIGYLDPYVTITGFCVQPVVAVIPSDFQPEPDAREVAEVLTLPVERVLDINNHRRHNIAINGSRGSYLVIGQGREMIWGATAGMLANFAEKLAL